MVEDAPPGKVDGLELLRISERADNVLVRPGGAEAEGIAVSAFVVRARRLVRAIYLLLDADHDIEAEILARALIDTTVTFLWLCVDLKARRPRWRLDDARTRMEWDDEYAAANDGERLLSPEDRAELEGLKEELERSYKGMPNFRQLCEAVERKWYSLLYRPASHGATHPSSYALGFFVEQVEAGTEIRAWGPRTVDETYPYESAALWLYLVLEAAAETTRRTPWTKESLEPVMESIIRGLRKRGDDV